MGNLFLKLKDFIWDDYGVKPKIDTLTLRKYNPDLSDLDNAIAFTKSWEGGYSAYKKDGGNWSGGKPYVGQFIGSKYGITYETVVAYTKQPITQQDMINLSDSLYEEIYLNCFWLKMGCDKLPRGIDLMVCDHGYNRGGANGVKSLQKAVGCPPDGILGPTTIYYTNSFLKSRGFATLVSALETQQILDYRRLDDIDFQTGWINRCQSRADFAKSMVR